MALRGGSRPGAGRPVGTGKFSEPTKPIRVPISAVNSVFTFVDQKCLRIPKCTDKELEKYHAARPADKWYYGEIRPKGDFTAVTVSDVLAGGHFKENDILIVKRNAVPIAGDYIIVNNDGIFSIDIMKDDMPESVWGIITYSIRAW